MLHYAAVYLINILLGLGIRNSLCEKCTKLMKELVVILGEQDHCRALVANAKHKRDVCSSHFDPR